MMVLRTIAVLAALATMGGKPAVAQPKTASRSAIVQSLADCRKIADNIARLACFDQAAAVLDQAEAKGDIVVVDREQARGVRRQAFGFTLPSLALFEKGETQEEVETVSAALTSARLDANGRWVVTLEGGAVWSQVDSTAIFRTPKSGMAVKVRRASLGSYLMSIDGQRAFRVRRVE